MKTELKVSVARRSKLLVNTGFKNYDICLNTYVGCQFGCSYCYVRFFIKDPQHDWGEFVRLRAHVEDKLPKELPQHGNARLVIGTMTDPYQPLERKHRITRAALQLINASPLPLAKVGIFTRSPIVLDDLDEIVKLPRKRVHFTITPYTPEILHRLEPIAIRTERRFDTIQKLKEAGVRIHANIAPAIPTISEDFTTEFAEKLAEIGVDEFFVDPMQAYGQSWDAMKDRMHTHESWPGIEEVMTDKARYAAWKGIYRAQWEEAWEKVRESSPHTLAIWSDHEHKVWINMRTGEQMDHKHYGDDE